MVIAYDQIFQLRETVSLLEESSALDLLDRIVCSLTNDAFLRQDLRQEALLHLWRMEQARPGQTRSWYLQSCRFALQHYLNAGRSVDSLKRRGAQVTFNPEDDANPFGACDALTLTECAEQSDVRARDILSSIASRLPPKERAVLDGLADGLNTSEIASRLNLSCPTVTKFRRKIAAQALKVAE